MRIMGQAAFGAVVSSGPVGFGGEVRSEKAFASNIGHLAVGRRRDLLLLSEQIAWLQVLNIAAAEKLPSVQGVN